MSKRWLWFVPLVAVCLACSVMVTGCGDDDDDDDPPPATNVVEGAEEEPVGPSTMASGDATVESGSTLVTSDSPGEGTVTGTASWDLPGLAGTVILTIDGAQADSQSGVGGATVSGHAEAGEACSLRVEFGLPGEFDVSYSLAFVPD